MKAPTVQNMAADEARENLQKAINHIAEIYTAIGDLPYGVVRGDPAWRTFTEFYDRGERMLDDLATDPIPF